MSDCGSVCGGQHEPVEAKQPALLSRRSLLSALAAALATAGLASASDVALAAAKKYKLCKTTDIKVGGSKVVRLTTGQALYVTQPKKNVFRAFDVYCTHQRVVLGAQVGKNIVCGVHGSKFSTDTGAVTQGPAQRALKKYTVTVAGTQVSVTI
jgi:nitrite reductase/ring-hydroxylating ferredoxin subunit